jgi:hypothetical protein
MWGHGAGQPLAPSGTNSARSAVCTKIELDCTFAQGRSSQIALLQLHHLCELGVLVLVLLPTTDLNVLVDWWIDRELRLILCRQAVWLINQLLPPDVIVAHFAGRRPDPIPSFFFLWVDSSNNIIYPLLVAVVLKKKKRRNWCACAGHYARPAFSLTG